MILTPGKHIQSLLVKLTLNPQEDWMTQQSSETGLVLHHDSGLESKSLLVIVQAQYDQWKLKMLHLLDDCDLRDNSLHVAFS